MDLMFQRRFRTKDLEWFDIIFDGEADLNLYGCLMLNNKDQSKNFSANLGLKKLKKYANESKLNINMEEYMKVHLFIDNKKLYGKFVNQIVDFYVSLLRYKSVNSCLFTHFVKEPQIAGKRYLMKWGIDKRLVDSMDSEFYTHLSQDTILKSRLNSKFPHLVKGVSYRHLEGDYIVKMIPPRTRTTTARLSAHVYDRKGKPAGAMTTDIFFYRLPIISFTFDRRLSTRDLEWFDIKNDEKGLHACLIINDKDRSKDFFGDPHLKRLKEKDTNNMIGEEFINAHLFINSKIQYDRFGEEIGGFYENMVHHLNIHIWLSVHIVRDPQRATKRYLTKWGIDKKKWKSVLA